MVYAGICRFSPPASIQVLAPWRHYQTGEILHGWQEYDAHACYRIHRLELLRPLELKSSSRWRSLWLSLSRDTLLKFRVLIKTVQIIRREQINVVCIGELSSLSWLGLICQRWLGVKMINYIHGEEVTIDLGYRYFGQRRREYLRRADAVVAVSCFTRQALIEQMQVDPAKIELLHNGVDLDRFQPAPRNETLLDRYYLHDHRILLTVGRLVPRKGIDMTLHALPRILEQCPDVHYLIVGVGPYRDELEQLVRQLRLADHVTFTGTVASPELADHYRLCDLFVMPNREMADHDTEGFGLVFLEANACGKAVVGGRAGGAVEAVRDGENGLLVNGADPGEIAAAVIRLLSDAELRQRLEAGGLAAAQAASVADNAQRFYRLCQRLVDEHVAP